MSIGKTIVNPQFYYRGNEGNQGEAIKFFTAEDTIDTMFNELTQVKEIAIVLNEDGTLYKTKKEHLLHCVGK